MNQQLPRDQRRSLERAARKASAAGGDPATAAELEQLRAVRTGAYALMHVLVSKLGGSQEKPIQIPRGDWQALPPLERLKVIIDPETSDATLYIEKTTG
jgi:hypothetical protein